MKFGLFPKYLYDKFTKALHPDVVPCIILTSSILFLGKNFNMNIVDIRRVYATNKNKVSIIIWSPTVFRVWLFLNKFVIYVHYLINIHELFPLEFCIIHHSLNLMKFIKFFIYIYSYLWFKKMSTSNLFKFITLISIWLK